MDGRCRTWATKGLWVSVLEKFVVLVDKHVLSEVNENFICVKPDHDLSLSCCDLRA